MLPWVTFEDGAQGRDCLKNPNPMLTIRAFFGIMPGLVKAACGRSIKCCQKKGATYQRNQLSG